MRAGLRGAERDGALDTAAGDFLLKPFSDEVLFARSRALLLAQPDVR